MWGAISLLLWPQTPEPKASSPFDGGNICWVSDLWLHAGSHLDSVTPHCDSVTAMAAVPSSLASIPLTFPEATSVTVYWWVTDLTWQYSDCHGLQSNTRSLKHSVGTSAKCHQTNYTNQKGSRWCLVSILWKSFQVCKAEKDRQLPYKLYREFTMTVQKLWTLGTLKTFHSKNFSYSTLFLEFDTQPFVEYYGKAKWKNCNSQQIFSHIAVYKSQ